MASSEANAAKPSQYESLWDRVFATDMDPKPLLRGIMTYEQALEAHKAIHRHDGRRKHKRKIAEKLQQYQDS